eukprot:11821602-Ditylum_brightwellii.AAC.1
MAQFNVTKNQTDIATIIKNIRHQEEVKSYFRMMRPISKGQQGGAVSHILVLDELDSSSMYDEVLKGLGFEPTWIPIDDDDQVMSSLLVWNKLHLHQAWETPCTRGAIKDYLGKFGLGQGAQDILEGHFDPNLAENLPALNYWHRHNIWRVAMPGSIEVDLSLQEYKDVFKSQDESTSSSPS